MNIQITIIWMIPCSLVDIRVTEEAAAFNFRAEGFLSSRWW
jgi:hypothetical protein